MVPLLQPGLTRASLHDDRLGQILDALLAAHLNRVFGTIAFNALEGRPRAGSTASAVPLVAAPGSQGCQEYSMPHRHAGLHACHFGACIDATSSVV